MNESPDNQVLSAILKVNTFNDLKASIPPAMANELGGGEKGVLQAVGMLISLTPFAPAPATFGRDAFNAVIALDYETQELLPETEAQKMLDVALRAGFIQSAGGKPDRFTVKEELQEAVKRVAPEE